MSQDNHEKTGQRDMKRRSAKDRQKGLPLGAMAIILCLLVAGGCASFSKPPYLVEQYTLEYSPPAPEGKPMEEALMVERFSTAQTFNSTAMVYRPDSFKLATYAYNRWRVNPGDMVTDYLLRDLRNGGIARAVFSYRDPAKGRYSVEGGIEEFLQVMDKDGPKAVLRITVTLIDTNQAELPKRLLFQKEYSIAEPLKENSPAAYAEGMSRAMSRFSTLLVKDLRDALKTRVGG